MRMSNANIIKEALLILAAFLFGWAETYAQRLSYFSEENEEGTTRGYQTANGERYCSVYTIGTMPDAFTGGLRRIVKEGKIGFINKKGIVVIAPEYDQAERFAKKICAVNKGATPIESSATDEYAIGPNEGGLWGVINNKGEVIIPIQFTRRWNEQLSCYEYTKGPQGFLISPKGKINFIKRASIQSK